MVKPLTSLTVPAVMKSRYDEIVALTDAFCLEKLNEEYAKLVRLATATLARKRPSPLLTGHSSTWACGIIYAIGFVNFLFDKATQPHSTPEQLARAFNISKSTAGNKSKQIRDLLKMHQFDYRWYLPERVKNSSLPWMVSVNGFILDARTLPQDMQIQAYHKGLIPYLPESE